MVVRKAVSEAVASQERTPEAYPPGSLRIFRGENEVGRLFRRFQRLLKISASKAAGSGTTEAYPGGTSQ